MASGWGPITRRQGKGAEVLTDSSVTVCEQIALLDLRGRLLVLRYLWVLNYAPNLMIDVLTTVALWLAEIGEGGRTSRPTVVQLPTPRKQLISKPFKMPPRCLVPPQQFIRGGALIGAAECDDLCHRNLRDWWKVTSNSFYLLQDIQEGQRIIRENNKKL